MKDRSLEVRMLESALTYIESIKDLERLKIFAQIKLLSEGDYGTLHVKQLSGPVRELIIKQHRIVYFKKGDAIYCVSAFKKQSAKTPRREIEHARQVFKKIS